jgi:hypothetical protein
VTAVPEGLVWTPVLHPRRVIYYRLELSSDDGRRMKVGSIACHDDGWRAVGYGRVAPTGNRELGTYDNRGDAERAVYAHWARGDYRRSVADSDAVPDLDVHPSIRCPRFSCAGVVVPDGDGWECDRCGAVWDRSGEHGRPAPVSS